MGGYSQEGVPPQPGIQPVFQPGHGQPGGYAAGPGLDGLVEDGLVKGFDFTEKTIRRAFIRKVFLILTCQLLITLSFITLSIYSKPTKIWFKYYCGYIIIAAVLALLVTLIAMACSETVRRTFPMNLIFLGIFTVALSFLLGGLSSIQDTKSVMIAVGITAGVCLSLILFALQTKWDFTTMGGILFSFFVVLSLFGLIAPFIGDNNMTTLAFASLGALLFSFYLVYDIQLMMGGNHKYSISPEEYIFAALSLYLDITRIFLYILRIVASR